MTGEKKLVLSGIATAIVIITLAAVFVPTIDDRDPRPTTTNAGTNGAKAAFVLLGRLGYTVQRSDDSFLYLNSVDAEHTTLVMADPRTTFNESQQAAVDDFIKRGGHVLADGSSGASLLPGFYWLEDGRAPALCVTTPQGISPLAEAGQVRFHPTILAKDNLIETFVAQSCADGGAVIYYSYGKGSIVWWASPEPLTNRGLHEDANLRLLLASVGDTGRTVIFSESDADAEPASAWDKTKGIPLTALGLQLLLVLLLLFLTYGRRHGPLRTLATTPRTSPLEFAHSMGNLYHQAGAGEAAIVNARLRLLQLLEQRCGVSHDAVLDGPAAIASSLRERFNYVHPDLVTLLEKTEISKRTDPAQALDLVKEVNRFMDDVQQRVYRQPKGSEENLLV